MISLLSFLLWFFCNEQAKSSWPCGLKETKEILGDTVHALDTSLLIVYHAKNNQYWFGSDVSGVYKYDPTSGIIIHYNKQDGLAGNRIREIQEDREGTIYFTTEDGISKYNGTGFYTLPLANSVIHPSEWRLDPEDMWFKPWQGKGGPYRYDGIRLHHLQFPKHFMEDDYFANNPSHSWSPYDVYHIYEDRRGHMWFGTSNFGLCRYDGNSFSWMYEDHLTNIAATGGSFGIRSILEDHEGKFWICNNQFRYVINHDDASKKVIDKGNSGILVYTREPGFKYTFPNGDNLEYMMAMLEDEDGHLWMVTYSRGVYRYDGKNVTHFPFKENQKQVKAYSIYQDQHDQIWVGTHDSGAYLFNGKSFEKFIP